MESQQLYQITTRFSPIATIIDHIWTNHPILQCEVNEVNFSNGLTMISYMHYYNSDLTKYKLHTQIETTKTKASIFTFMSYNLFCIFTYLLFTNRHMYSMQQYSDFTKNKLYKNKAVLRQKLRKQRLAYLHLCLISYFVFVQFFYSLITECSNNITPILSSLPFQNEKSMSAR